MPVDVNSSRKLLQIFYSNSNNVTSLFMTNKKTGLESCHTVAEEDWPEIENMFPVDPQGKNY